MTSAVVAQRAASTGAHRIFGNLSGIVFTAVFYLMVTGVLASLWHAAVTATGGDIVGYSSAALIWYVATSEAATIALPQRLIEEVGTDIKQGVIEIEMLRPASVLFVRIASEVGSMLARLSICVSCGLAFCLIFVGLPLDGWALMLAGPSLIMALLLGLLAQHAFAGIAFWIRDATAMWFLYQKLIFILGGMLLPLEVLPQTLETVAKWLPFMAMAYAPARLASGHFEPLLLLVQLGWLIAVGALAAWVFHRGQARLLEAAS